MAQPVSSEEWNLVLVVREAQVDPAAVDVERLAQIAAGHGRAFDVPAGPASAPRRRPRRGLGLARLGSLPQREIMRIALVRLDVGLVHRHVRQRLAGEGAVVREAGDVEVHVPGISDVGVPGVENGLDELDLVGDVPGGPRLVRGRKDPERAICLRKLPLVTVSPLPPGAAGLGGLAQNLVVDVRDVADHPHVVPAAAQPSCKHVEGERRTHMADVRGALDGCAAQVDPRPARFERFEVSQRVHSGIVDLQAHPPRVSNERRKGFDLAHRTPAAEGCARARRARQVNAP